MSKNPSWWAVDTPVQIKKTHRLGDIIEIKGKKAFVKVKDPEEDEEPEQWFTQKQLQQVLPW